MFVVLGVVGVVISCAVGLGARKKECHCDTGSLHLECCHEGTDGTCPGQCACGIYRVCRKKESTLDSESVAAVLIMILVGTVGVIGTLVCLCVKCCCNDDIDSILREQQLPRLHLPVGGQPCYSPPAMCKV